MNFISTRGDAAPASLSDALIAGLAPDGGLYKPEHFPAMPLDGAQDLRLPRLAERLLAPFFEGDDLAAALSDLCDYAFMPDAPLVPGQGSGDYDLLELFHGPTGAFKDFGARFLAGALDRLGDADNPFTVLVATSGDTGGAVGAAFENMPHARAVILFPKGRVSPFQKHQLCCWEDVRAFEVDGDFDDCQLLVKQAFADEDMRARHRLTSANSISLGRLLPQAAYFFHAALEAQSRHGAAPGIIIPTGNMGNALACLWARACGAPIREVLIAVNANRTLADYFDSGDYRARASVQTLANAMDVGDPSNFERFRADAGALQIGVRAVSVADDVIPARISDEYQRSGRALCPHSAVGAEAFARLSDQDRARLWILTATAHPYKFREIVEPAIGMEVAPPRSLAAVLDRPQHNQPLKPDLAALSQALIASD